MKAEKLQILIKTDSIPDMIQTKEEDYKVEHFFAPGVYVRTLHIPAGHTIVGKTHKTEHLNQVLKGNCLVNIRGKQSHRLSGAIFLSYIGDKKIISAIEDTIWATIHPTKETDIDIIESLLIDEEAELLIEEAVQAIKLIP